MAGQIPRPANVEVTNTGTVYHVQEDGTKVIAGSRRPDGTYRKPVRVRAGYTPLEENLYKGPEVQQRAQARGIPGLGPVETQRPSRSGCIPGMAPEKEPKAKAKAPSTPKAEGEKPKAKAAPKADAKAKAAPAEPAKPENRLRNLRKKLAEINSLEGCERDSDSSLSRSCWLSALAGAEAKDLPERRIAKRGGRFGKGNR
ncbi:unnamed protein product [Durusdinium trenchii]|uniref:WIBG Mago-binding domain-containing protein n=2 Tax=Durusdinium trenchii TaxID=1381693 RepID=A0ABP0PFT3_9DINO